MYLQSVAQFRSALNSYLQSAGVVTADTPSTAAAVGGKFSDDNEDEDETST